MRTLHPGIRVSDLRRSLAFYGALGYAVIGQVPGTTLGRLTLLQLDDDEFAALELIDDPGRGSVDVGTGFSHLAVQVDSLERVLAAVERAGFAGAGIGHPGGVSGPRTANLADPDGYRIELTEWPPGHPAGLSRADFVP